MILNMCCGCIENLELLLEESLDVTCSSKGSTDDFYKIIWTAVMMISVELCLSYSFKNDFDIQSTMKKILNLTGSSIDESTTVKPTINPVLFIMLAINGLLIGSLGPIGTRLTRSHWTYEVERFSSGLKGSIVNEDSGLIMWYYNGILQYVVSHEGLIARDQKKSRHMRNVLWYTSIFVVFGIPYWVINKGN